MSEAEIMALAERGLAVLEEAGGAVWPWLSSELAQRVYVVLGLLTLLVLAIRAAKKEARRLRKLGLNEFVRKKPGPKPQKLETIENRINEMVAFQAQAWKRTFGSVGSIFLLGVFLPSVMFFVAAQNSCWFGASQPFLGQHCPFPQGSVSSADILMFVLNQFFHGVLLDTFEVFDVELGLLRSNPGEIVFSISILIYRTVVGPFSIVLIVFLVRALAIQWQLNKRLGEWHEKRRRVG